MRFITPLLLFAAALLGASLAIRCNTIVTHHHSLSPAASGVTEASAPDCPPKIKPLDNDTAPSNSRRFQFPYAGGDPELHHQPLGDVDGDGKPDHAMRSQFGTFGGSSNRGVIYIILSKFTHAGTPGGSVFKELDPTQDLPDGVLAIYGVQSLAGAKVQFGNFSDGPSMDLLIRDQGTDVSIGSVSATNGGGVFIVLDVANLLSDSSRSLAVELDPANLPPFIFGAVGFQDNDKIGASEVSRVALNSTFDALLIESEYFATSVGAALFVKVTAVTPQNQGSTHPAIVLDTSSHIPGVFGFRGQSSNARIGSIPTLAGSIFGGSAGQDLVVGSYWIGMPISSSAFASEAGGVFIIGSDLVADLALNEEVIELDPTNLPAHTLAYGSTSVSDKLGKGGVSLEFLDDDALHDIVIRTPEFDYSASQNAGAIAVLASKHLPQPSLVAGESADTIRTSRPPAGVLLLYVDDAFNGLGSIEYQILDMSQGAGPTLVVRSHAMGMNQGGIYLIHPVALNDLSTGRAIRLSLHSVEEGMSGFAGFMVSDRLGIAPVLMHDFGHGPRLVIRNKWASDGSIQQVGAVFVVQPAAFEPAQSVQGTIELTPKAASPNVATFYVTTSNARLTDIIFSMGPIGASGNKSLVVGSHGVWVSPAYLAGGTYILHSAMIEASMGSVVDLQGSDNHPGLVRIVGAVPGARLGEGGFQVLDVDGNNANDLVLFSSHLGRRQGATSSEGAAGSIVLVHDSLLDPQEDTLSVPIDPDALPNGVMALVGSCEDSGIGTRPIDVSSFATSAVPRFIASAPGSNCMASLDGDDDRGAVYIIDPGVGGLNFSQSTASTLYLDANNLPAGVVGIFGGHDGMRVGEQAPVVGEVGGSAEPDLLLSMPGFSTMLQGQSTETVGAVAVFLDPLLSSEQPSSGITVGGDTMPDGSYLLVASDDGENMGGDTTIVDRQVTITSKYGIGLLDFTPTHFWLSSFTVNGPQGDEVSTVVEGDQAGQVVARFTALDNDYASASDVAALEVLLEAIDPSVEDVVLDGPFQVYPTVPQAGTASLTLSLGGTLDYEVLASALAGTDAEPVNATLLALLQAGSRPDLDVQLSARLCDQDFPRTAHFPLNVQDAPEPTSVDAFPIGSSDHIIDVTEGEPTADATFHVVLSDGDFIFPADALNARIVVTSTDPMWAPLKGTDGVLQPGSSFLSITVGTPAVVIGSATYTVTVGTTSLDYEALAGALADFPTSSAPDIELEFEVQFETAPGVWGAASETATLTLSNAVEPPASVTGSDMSVTENAATEFPAAATFPTVSALDALGLTFHIISTNSSYNTGSVMENGQRALNASLAEVSASGLTTSSADITVAAIDMEALQALTGVDLMAPDHPATFTFPIKFVACGPSSCVESQEHVLIVADVVEPELTFEPFEDPLTYTIDEATLLPTTPTVQDFYVRLHDLNRPGNLLHFTLNLQGPSGNPVLEPLQGLTASCGAFTHTSPNAYLEATCSIDTADASLDLEALRVAVEGTVTTASPLNGQHYSVEGAMGEAPLSVVVSSSIPEQDNVQGPAYDVLVADMDEDPLELALDEAELFTCLESADEAQIMMVVPGYDPDFSVETFDGFGTFSVLPDEVTITSSVGPTSLPTLSTTATVTGPHGISNKGTRFNVTIRCGPHLDFETLLAATPLTAEDGVLSVPTLGHDLTVPLYDYIGGGAIQPIVTTATGGQFGDVNEFPIPSGALRSRAFMLQENGGPGAPLGALTAFHVDAGDSLSSVLVHSASDSLTAVETSPGVWALQTAPDAVFNFEVPSSSQEGATDSVSSAIVGGTSSAASVAESNQDAADRPERRLPVAFNVHDPCGAVSVPGAATADFSNTDAYMGTNQVPSNIPHAAAPVPPEGSRVVPFCVELTDDGDNLDAVGGAKTTLVPAYLYILDRNDPPKLANSNPDPEGEPTYTDHFTLMENADVGVPFGIIRVADEDGDEVSSIQVLGMGSEHFEFVHNGSAWRIHAKTSFDFENPPARSDGSQGSNTWGLLVRLIDSPTDGEPASRNVSVSVTIDNENEAPTYTGPSNFTAFDGAAVGTVVGALTFADPEGHAVTATLSPASAPFALVATGTGYDLTTAGELDLESGTSQYNLTLSGQDSGSPPLPVSADIVVNVKVPPAPTPTRTPVPTPTATVTAVPSPSATGSPAPVQPSPSVTPTATTSPSTTPVPGVVRQPTDDVCKNARDHTVVGSEAEPNPIVIFAGTSVLTGMEVCKVDAAGSVTLLIDAYPGTAGSNPRNFRKMGARVCWMSDVSEVFTQFLCYEPTGGVTILRTLPRRRGRALASGTAPGTFLGASGSLAFFADDLSTPSTGVELYTLDVESSTGAAPTLVQDLAPGANSTTFTTAATAPDGTFYFTTTTALHRVQVDGGITASATALVIPRGASVHSTQAVRGAVLVTYTDAAGVAFLRRLDTITGTVSVAAFEPVSDASTFSTPRHAVAGANNSYFAWRSEGDASLDAVWVFDPSADQELAQVATLPAPAGAPEDAVGVVTGLEVSNGRVYVEVASSIGSATGIFAWMGGAWAPITSVEVTAGRVSGSNPAALHAAGVQTLAFTTSDGVFILDTARAAVAAGVVPSPSATPSPSPAPAAAEVALVAEEDGNSGTLWAGVTLIVILFVAVGAFMVYRAGLCKRGKKEDKPAEAAPGGGDTGATAPSTEQSSAAAAQA